MERQQRLIGIETSFFKVWSPAFTRRLKRMGEPPKGGTPNQSTGDSEIVKLSRNSCLIIVNLIISIAHEPFEFA
jgi:hypothetical protein